MKDQELQDKFHAYRPQIDDNEAFMDKLMAQMDAVDELQHAHIIPFYRRILPWVAGVAAASVVAVFIMRDPATTPTETTYKSRLPEYYNKVTSPIPDFSSYEDIVNEIERSGKQLEDAIAQL
ncbi:MAG: hypothetical protein IJL54_08030 [Prevotella sp.]|nr:hypothetical protein [Prevotella sp.]